MLKGPGQSPAHGRAQEAGAARRDVAQVVNALEPEIQALSDDELRARTGEFRARLGNGATLDDLLPEAFAAVREAAVAPWGSATSTCS